MPKPKAPDNMPTEAIRRFLETAKEEKRQWNQSVKESQARLKSAKGMVAYHTEREAEYKGWLAKRLEDERG